MGSIVEPTRFRSILIALSLLCACPQNLSSSVFAAGAELTIDGRSVRLLELKAIKGPISLRLNQEVAIRAEALRAAGYSWSAQSDQDAVHVSEVRIPRSEGDAKIVGAPEPQYFLLRGSRSGTSTIEFRYGRSWEPQNVRDDFKLIVNVE